MRESDMRELTRRRPSAAMVVAIVALIVAASGTAVAASRMVNGDSLIKKNSLSGNRLRTHSITGKEIRLSSLGQVPNARNAGDANALGGQKASAFVTASTFDRSGLVTANGGQTVTPPDAYQVYLIDAIFMPGTTAPCAASMLVAKS